AERKEQQQAVAHPLADEVEEFAGEVGLPPFARAGVLVEIPHRVPLGAADLAATQRADLESFLGRFALLADGLALAAAQPGEEIVEARIAAIEPVILDAEPNEPAAPIAFKS